MNRQQALKGRSRPTPRVTNVQGRIQRAALPAGMMGTNRLAVSRFSSAAGAYGVGNDLAEILL